MAELLAIEIDGKNATFVCAEKSATNRLYIKKAKTFSLSELFPEEIDQDTENTEDTKNPSSHKNGKLKNPELVAFLPKSIGSAAAIISKNNVLYEHLELPFKDSKKIAKVAPLQIQDNLPFDIDDFLINNTVVRKKDENKYQILSSLIPKKDIALNLAELAQFEIDPEVVCTRAGALAHIPKLFPNLRGNYAIISISKENCSIAIFIENSPVDLRELSIDAEDLNKVSISRDIKSTLARVEIDHAALIEKVYLAEGDEILRELLKGFPLNIETLDTKKFIENKTDRETDFSWTLGLFAGQLTPKNQEIEPVVNFRTGPFAYKEFFKNFTAAAREEMPYFIAATIMCFLYVISVIVAGERHLSQLEGAIDKRLSTINLSEELPYGLEVSSLENKIAELEEQLMDIGSLSSLSPLEGLKVISEAFDKSLDIHIDAMNIKPSSISFRGSVPDLTSVGKISAALERSPEKFCKVTIDPKGKDRARGRFIYSADIELCT